MLEKENIIRKYFAMWIDRNFDAIEEVFDINIYYSECYGPEYQGISEIKQWITKNMKEQVVLEWNIKQFIHQDNIVVVEWFFKDISGEEHAFDGVSIIVFNNQNKILSIKEFESKSTHTTPFR
jgi:hypothetical protein